MYGASGAVKLKKLLQRQGKSENFTPGSLFQLRAYLLCDATRKDFNDGAGVHLALAE